VSASARGTASDYSKGSPLHRGDFATSHGLLAALAVAGAALLVVAELSPLYTIVVGALGTPRRSVSGGSSHGYALVAVAVVAVAMAYGALRGARRPAAALVALGCVVLLVALAIDAPKTRRSAGLPEAVAYADARAQAGSGFALEIAGGVALVVAGGLMLALGAPQPLRRKPR
jgi:hypothetical protein